MDNKFEIFFSQIDTFLNTLEKAYNAVNVGSNDIIQLNHELYSGIIGENYEHSFVNPVFAEYMLGSGYGKLCSFVAYESFSLIGYRFDKKRTLTEPFLQMYQDIKEMYTTGSLSYNTFYDRIYEYLYSTADALYEDRIKEMLFPHANVAKQIITGDGLGDVYYLYRYGEYITETEIKTARHINLLSKEKLRLMADTFAEGYRRGFETTGKPFDKKRTVGIIYKLGFERLVNAEIEAFERLGLTATVFRTPRSAVISQGGRKNGFFGASSNHQAEYDHKNDALFFFDEKLVSKRLEALEKAYEKYAEYADVYGGPAVMEVFGEAPFDFKESGCGLIPGESQKKLSLKYLTESAAITNRFIKGEERSFTIIAYPTPDIGKDFKDIFNETIELNTLDNDLYISIQQRIIDVLNEASFVDIKGTGENQTDISVELFHVNDPEKEENFENCVADVNIPVGEVFTSPVLSGTNGILHVSRAFLNGFEYKDLRVEIRNGFTKDYSCANFSDPEKGREYFRKNVLFEHEKLPVGEFAIGTNTTAYAMAKEYDIQNVLPILIAEKTGPHFALGDTCYSRSEDIRVFNPGGKEITAKDNEVSIKRKDDPGAAYFNCHTDITIPYEEIGRLTAVKEDGTKTDIIKSGRFVLPGTEMLNIPLDD